MGSRRIFLRLVILSMFIVALSSLGFAQGWQIVSAEYGAGNRRIDVTRRVRHLLRDNGNVPVDNDAMGGDPAPGEVKSLHIRATRPDGRFQDFNFREHESFNAGMFVAGPDEEDRDRDRDRDHDRGPGPVWGRGPRPSRGACFYKDINFGGDYFCMTAGQAYGYLPPGFNDKISAIRVFHAEVIIFNDHDFHGVSGQTRRNIGDLRNWRLPSDPGRSWNDRVSSLQVN